MRYQSSLGFVFFVSGGGGARSVSSAVRQPLRGESVADCGAGRVCGAGGSEFDFGDAAGVAGSPESGAPTVGLGPRGPSGESVRTARRRREGMFCESEPVSAASGDAGSGVVLACTVSTVV